MLCVVIDTKMNTPKHRHKLTTPQRPKRGETHERKPAYLYHGTHPKNFESIKEQGLMPFSKGEKGVKPYISFSSVASATPLLSGNTPNDIVFRIKTRKYNVIEKGSGKKEWRTHEEIAPIDITYVLRKELKQTPVPWRPLVAKYKPLQFV